MATPDPDRTELQQAAENAAPYILIVDDQYSDLCLLEAILRSHGFRYYALTDPTKVLERCRTVPPEIILLDISMPKLDGFQVCARLKKNPGLADIPVLFLTAMSDVSSRIRGFKAGGSDFLVKPYEPSELIARVTTHLKLRSIQLELARKNEQLKEKINDIERAHAALLESESRNEAVLNNAGVCIGLLNTECTYEKVNGLYAQIFGYSEEEFRTMQLQDILHPDFAARLDSSLHWGTDEVLERDLAQFVNCSTHYNSSSVILQSWRPPP